jgi:ABC-type thiamine transport system substrate-binding protein
MTIRRPSNTDHQSPFRHPRKETKHRKNDFPASEMVQMPLNSFVINENFEKLSTNFVDFMHQTSAFPALNGPSRL